MSGLANVVEMPKHYITMETVTVDPSGVGVAAAQRSGGRVQVQPVDGAVTVQGNVPTHQSSPRDGLGYSRHYARRMRDLGRTSKDSWIQRLWNHMFLKKADGTEEQVKMIRNGMKVCTKEVHKKDQKLPIASVQQAMLIYRQPMKIAPLGTSGGGGHSGGHRGVNPSLRDSPKPQKTLAAELANSPYMNPQHRNNYRFERTKQILASVNQQQQQNHHHAHNHHHGSTTAPPSGIVGVSNDIRDAISRKKHDNAMQWKHGHPYTTVHPDPWRYSNTRLPAAVQIEKRAKSMAEKAMANAHIFSCEGPYPVDLFVRYSLRKRGWVEKFIGSRGLAAMSGNGQKHTPCRLECQEDEDFEAICDQEIPAPWDEEYGLHATMSRVVRHHPTKFIWGGRNVNNLILRNDVIVNHFAKSRAFSSKICLTLNLRDLPWINSTESNEFFPRSYLLSEDEKDPITDDFRLTACICLLKHLRKNRKVSSSVQKLAPLTPMTFTYDDASICDRVATAKTIIHNDSDNESLSGKRMHQIKADDEFMEITDNLQDQDLSGSDTEEESKTNSVHVEYTKNGNLKERMGLFRTTHTKVLPNLCLKTRKLGCSEVPLQAANFAIQHLNNFIRCQQHNDVDLRGKHGLAVSQWPQLLSWIYSVIQDGAQVTGVSESMEKEAANILDKVEQYLPQFNLDGTRNIWIVKPGDKSKGIGIDFVDNLEDIMKYVSNSTIQGTYVLQKYVERPLLLHRVKFDIRQWFLVSDWNPLTLWIYKDSYLRICSQEYTYDTKHESVHLSNVAVQQNYLNGKRSSRLPSNNFMTSEQFKDYLSSVGHEGVWDDITYPAMKEAIISTLSSSVDIQESRKNAFELYGADFILTEDFKPWLLEVNSSPGMAATSPEKVKLCSQVVEDLVKVVLDRRENKSCDTGRFELVNKEICSQPISTFKCVDTKFMVEGLKVKKADLQKYSLLDAKHSKSDRKIAEKEMKDKPKIQEETKSVRSKSKTKEKSFIKSDNNRSNVKSTSRKEQWTDIISNNNT